MQEFVKIPLDILRQTKRGSPFSETDALADILSMADENGEFYSSTRKLMSRWGWGCGKTTSFIKKLEEQNIIGTQTEHKRNTLYRINTGFVRNMRNTNGTQTEHKRNTKPNEHAEVCTRIIEHLNTVLGTKYRCDSAENTREIEKRLKENYKEEDFFTVIDKKAKEWKGTEREKYLRPDVLFGNKFECYLNQKIIDGKKANKFNSFPQREYTDDDFKELEKNLLNR